MKHGSIAAGFAALMLVLSLGAAQGAEHASEHPGASSGRAVPGAKATVSRKADLAAKRKAAAAEKRIDVNSASKDVLMTLPGIGDAEASRIIAGRPYNSKSWLVTKKVIDASTYAAIKIRIEARQVVQSKDRVRRP